MNRHLLIFDLDGTLIDSKRDLVDSVNATRTWNGRDPLPDDVVASYVGSGAPVLIRRAFPDAAEADLERLLRYFLDYYREHMLDATTLYPGVGEALDRLHSADVPMAILTNKPVRFSIRLIEGLGWTRISFASTAATALRKRSRTPGESICWWKNRARTAIEDSDGRRQRGGRPHRAQCRGQGVRRKLGISARDIFRRSAGLRDRRHARASRDRAGS